jgi:aspartyl-tRNA(Asn)/glutamyl-tRNA(Gln) amidotransferase subunit A
VIRARRAALACLDATRVLPDVWVAVEAADATAKAAIDRLPNAPNAPLDALPVATLGAPAPTTPPPPCVSAPSLVVAHPLSGSPSPAALPVDPSPPPPSDPHRAWVWREAHTPTANGPLKELAVGVKANLAVGGWPMTCGSAILRGHLAAEDATVVARLRAAGATIAGLTAMDELAMGSSGEHAIGGPTRNPWSAEHVPGGSSSGSAAAVAAGDVPVALGSDSGGSVRQPAACCGVVGFKPSYGVVSRFGLGAYAASMDTVGVLAKDVAHAARVAVQIAGPDGRDATCTRRIDGDWRTPDTPRPLRGQRIGVWQFSDTAAVAPSVLQAVEDAAQAAVAAGASVHRVAVPAWDDAMIAYMWLSYTEAASNLARYGGVFAGSAGTVASGTDYRAAAALRRAIGFGPEVQRRVLLGAAWAVDEPARVRRAQAIRRTVVEAAAAVFEEVSVLVLPTSPTQAFPVGDRVRDAASMGDADRFTIPANLAGLPALSLPWSVGDGLPTAVQLIGPRFADARVLRMAGVLERARGPWRGPGARV